MANEPLKKRTIGFTEEEKAAARERVQEMKMEAAKANGESAVLAKIASFSEPDRSVCKRIHAIIKTNAPSLLPRTWYGMPAYSNKDGDVVCYVRNSRKFKERYTTFGFNDAARLDEGHLWPVAFAVTKLTAAEEAKIATLVKKAVK